MAMSNSEGIAIDNESSCLLNPEGVHTSNSQGIAIDDRAPDCDVAIIGGGLVGAMASLMLQRRGLRTCVLESRPRGRDQKVVVGEAITEGSSVFLRHELGLGEWLKKNAFRKFGFDFVVRPRTGELPRTIDDCHELLLSLSTLEAVPGAFQKLIPTFHVDRVPLNRHVALLAEAAGADFRYGASVEQVTFSPGRGRIHFAVGGQPQALSCRFVLDCSGRRTVLGRQLGITRPAEGLNTAAVWNRFENVERDPAFWRSFAGVDRRKHTIHFTGPGFWIWWIHQNDRQTSVGVSYDRDQHQPDVKTEDHGFWEMIRQFPPVADALAGARTHEPYQYYAHLPYRSDHWISPNPNDGAYALIGDAAWFTDALYSIGIETACRQLTALVPLLVAATRGNAICPKEVAPLNMDFNYCQNAVLKLNAFKYKHGWHRPHVVMQTALYELGEIAELYHMQCPTRWKRPVLEKNYRLQWSTRARLSRLERFMHDSLADGERDLDGGPLLKKALLPGRTVYGATWPLWQLPHARPYFFILTRAWAYSERLAQRLRLWPDGLAWMAGLRPLQQLFARRRHDAAGAAGNEPRSARL
jgi:FADH2 O2-dependent halogenase